MAARGFPIARHVLYDGKIWFVQNRLDIKVKGDAEDYYILGPYDVPMTERKQLWVNADELAKVPVKQLREVLA